MELDADNILTGNKYINTNFKEISIKSLFFPILMLWTRYAFLCEINDCVFIYLLLPSFKFFSFLKGRVCYSIHSCAFLNKPDWQGYISFLSGYHSNRHLQRWQWVLSITLWHSTTFINLIIAWVGGHELTCWSTDDRWKQVGHFDPGLTVRVCTQKTCQRQRAEWTVFWLKVIDDCICIEL